MQIYALFFSTKSSCAAKRALLPPVLHTDFFFRSLVPPQRALFPSPTSRTSHSPPPLFVPRLQTFLKFPRHSYPPKDQNIIGSPKNLQRFSENLQRFSENLQRFSENLQRFSRKLQRFSRKLQRFSENLQRFSRKFQRFSRKLQRNEPTTPFSSLTSKL